MTTATLPAEGYGGIVRAAALTLARFLVNPFGWRMHATIHFHGTWHSPHVQLTRRWYLQERMTPYSGDVVLQKDRLGRRRVRILNLVEIDKARTRGKLAYVAAARWAITGNDEILRKLKA